MDEGTQTVTPSGIIFSSPLAPSTQTTVTPNQIVFNFTFGSTFGTGSFNGFQLSEVGASPQNITGVTIDPATDLTGFGASRVTFDFHDIFVNVADLPFSTNNNITLDITAAPVPEASTTVSFGLLLALGLGGAMIAARKKKRTA